MPEANNSQGSAGRPSGNRSAIVTISLMITVGSLVIGFFVLKSKRDRAAKKIYVLKCKNNLKQIAVGAVQYIDQLGSGRYYPKSIMSISEKIIKEKSIYLCPGDTTPGKLTNGSECSYESTFDRAGVHLGDRIPSRLPMLWESDPSHHAGQINVAFFDTSVVTIPSGQLEILLHTVDQFLAEQKVRSQLPGRK